MVAPSPFARQISVDVPRTFATHPYFAVRDGPGQAALQRVLHACVLYHPDVGYLQGMNLLGAVILVVLEGNEERAFWVLVAFLRLYRMQDYYKDGLVKLETSMATFGALLRAHLPDVAGHLDREGVIPHCYATAWCVENSRSTLVFTS